MCWSAKVLQLPRPVWEGATEQQVYLVVVDSHSAAAPPRVEMLPGGEAASAAAAAAAPSMHFWHADRASGAGQGGQLARMLLALLAC